MTNIQVRRYHHADDRQAGIAIYRWGIFISWYWGYAGILGKNAP